MELDWLETFLAVLDHGGFTAASLQVHRSQSRVSAHIAALEREVGLRLIDRTRRPAAITPAGVEFARHARDILAEVDGARSAMGVLRALDTQTLAVLTTPCIGAALLPGVFAGLLSAHPGLRFTVSEHAARDGEPHFTATDAVTVAVLPALTPPLPPGLQEVLLWRESFRAVVPEGHLLAHHGSAVALDQLARYPLIVVSSAPPGRSEFGTLLAGQGLSVEPVAQVDTVQTLAAMARAGMGVGVANAVALEHVDTTGLKLVDIAGPDVLREVAMYYYEVLSSTAVGRSLQRLVVHAPLPRGARPLGRPDMLVDRVDQQLEA